VSVRSRLLGKVERFCQGVAVQKGIVVAVSGGPDSVALLRALLSFHSTNPATRLVAAHLNHQLRGAESDADASFVEELCATLRQAGHAGLSWRCECIDVAARARSEGGNLEGVARRIRYAWLTDVARQEGLEYVATGHTADDQAETVLHRLLRGTGIKGLRGIASRRPLAPGIDVVRPLLRVTRVEVLDYLQALGQPFRQDSSNQDLRFTRNRIRSELLPYLPQGDNPGIVELLCRLAAKAEELFARREANAAALVAEAERPRAGGLIILDRQCLAAAPRDLVREAFRFIWARECWPSNGMNFEAWDRLAGLALGAAAALDLPGGIHARRLQRVVQLGVKS
jgi:tRNA(Ile)-lysidine synthase